MEQLALEAPNSSSSTTPCSTSTYQYHQEPFSSFRPKVIDLANNIGFEIDNVERLRGGSFNRIIAASCRFKDSDGHIRGQKCVFRIPRKYLQDGSDDAVLEDLHSKTEAADQERSTTLNHNSSGAASPESSYSETESRPRDFSSLENVWVDNDVLDNINILGLATSHGLPIPRVIAFDASCTNSIKSPYILQEFATGVRLEEVYESLSYEEKLSIVDELISIFMIMENITFQKIGKLRSTTLPRSRDIMPTATRSSEETFPYRSVKVAGFISGFDKERSVVTNTESTLYHTLVQLFDAWDTYEHTSPDPDEVDVYMKRVRKLFHRMNAIGFISPRSSLNSIILHHWDLMPRNILVERSEASGTRREWKINSVLDWDEALSAPAIIARKPPVWLWDSSTNSGSLAEYCDDYDLFPPGYYDHDNQHISFENLQIKNCFEVRYVAALKQVYPECDMQAYQDDTYGRGRWIRRIWKFALDGFSDTEHIRRLESLEKQWTSSSRSLP